VESWAASSFLWNDSTSPSCGFLSSCPTSYAFAEIWTLFAKGIGNQNLERSSLNVTACLFWCSESFRSFFTSSCNSSEQRLGMVGYVDTWQCWTWFNCLYGQKRTRPESLSGSESSLEYELDLLSG
jgi:hypothetical protein